MNTERLLTAIEQSKRRELGSQELAEIQKTILMITKPYADHACGILSMTMPIIEIERTEDGVLMKTRYPEDVQNLLSAIKGSSRDAVRSYLESIGRSYLLPEL